ncbi:MAG: hypothetical protein J7L14_00715 [Candidatus Diapherotrites archaeon]|nr:hypothetical protein [Candidatus Diapherotrites archaeon]
MSGEEFRAKVFVEGKEREVRQLTNEELIREFMLRMRFIREAITNRSYRASMPEYGFARFVRDFGLLKREYEKRRRENAEGIRKAIGRIEQLSDRIDREILARGPEKRAGLRPETKPAREIPLEQRIEKQILEVQQLLRGVKVSKPRTLRGALKRFLRGLGRKLRRKP